MRKSTKLSKSMILSPKKYSGIAEKFMRYWENIMYLLHLTTLSIGKIRQK